MSPLDDVTTTSAASLAVRICFEGLWVLADRKGRLEDRPVRLKADIFPYDVLDIEPLLAELALHGFIRRYVVKGLPYIDIPTFLKHQKPHPRESPSVIPGPTQGTPKANPRSTFYTPRRPVPKTVPKTETVPRSGDGKEQEQAVPPNARHDISTQEDKRDGKATRGQREPENPDDNVGGIAKLAHEFINQHGDDDTLKDRLKDACAQHHIAYNATVIGKAIDSARVVRRLRTPQNTPEAFEL